MIGTILKGMGDWGIILKWVGEMYPIALATSLKHGTLAHLPPKNPHIFHL